MQPEFMGWKKIPRWENETYVITEKLDGSNGCVIVTEHGDVFAQSRTRVLTEDSDNYEFCKWVNGNKDELLKLGVGYHYGEWWGKGINRNYGLREKRFSLFNHYVENLPDCVSVVPIVADTYEQAWERLDREGSIAVPGYMSPEGFVLQAKFHRNVRYKVLMNE